MAVGLIMSRKFCIFSSSERISVSRRPVFFLLLILVFTLALCAATVFASAQVRYVVQGATGNGTSWSNASGDLQEMINQSNPGEQVWVAKGTYVPERRGDDPFGGYDPNSSRCTFVIHEGVELYGGFAGGEGQLVQRNIVNNPTILDGRNRYYHVACIVGVNNAVLDGFTIRNGAASNTGQLAGAYMLINGNLIGDNVGGGIIVYSATSTKLANLIIERNMAIHGGGINMQYSSSCLLKNVILRYNTTNNDGGGMSIAVSDPTFVNVLINNNHVTSSGNNPVSPIPFEIESF